MKIVYVHACVLLPVVTRFDSTHWPSVFLKKWKGAFFFSSVEHQINVFGPRDVVCWESGNDDIKLLGFIYTIRLNLQATVKANLSFQLI